MDEEIKLSLEENIVRRISDVCGRYMKKRVGGVMIGVMLMYVHTLIMICCGIILMFSNNIFYLLCMFVFTMFDSCCIVVLHDCPLTKLEHKYMKRSIRSEITKKMRDMKIVYKCDHNYEKQLDFLINISSMLLLKMFVLISVRTLKDNFLS